MASLRENEKKAGQENRIVCWAVRMRRLPEARLFGDLEIRHGTSSTFLLLFHAVKSDELVDILDLSIGGLSMARSLETH